MVCMSAAPWGRGMLQIRVEQALRLRADLPRAGGPLAVRSPAPVLKPEVEGRPRRSRGVGHGPT